ncbi:hypothetical protein BE17_20025 [Sorangium cellulosum]|uniref:Secreted protein n=1 Tax=Sorangium cellulosum TaxID=56 RepID=A0A150R3G3_SORCE|nr:hypothetical protein BE17_20025 [Sorangium cellulosum]
MKITSTLSLVSLLGSTLLMVAGCMAPPVDSESEVDADIDVDVETTEEVGTAADAITNGWMPETSDGWAPIACDSGNAISAFRCRGSDCDNIKGYCSSLGTYNTSTYWTTYFSEESTNWRTCNAGDFVTGFACTGSYCDNVSLQCSHLNGKTWGTCYWSGFISEENGGTIYFPPNYYIAGAKCDGDHCDNMAFYYCQAY